jgi:hypothetical protein
MITDIKEDSFNFNQRNELNLSKMLIYVHKLYDYAAFVGNVQRNEMEQKQWENLKEIYNRLIFIIKITLPTNTEGGETRPINIPMNSYF